MPMFQNPQDYGSPDHLKTLFGTCGNAVIREGELMRLQCLDREVRALKEAMEGHPLDTVLISGEALKALLELV